MQLRIVKLLAPFCFGLICAAPAWAQGKGNPGDEVPPEIDLLANEVEDLQNDLGDLQNDVTDLQTDVGQLQTDVGNLQTDVGALETDVDNLQTDVMTIQGDIGDLQTDVSDLQDAIDAVEGGLGPKTVFVTSTSYTGDLGGLAGADQKCQDAADAAMLPGTYLAWLSTYPGPIIGTPIVGPSDRFTRSAAPYIRTDDVTVADHYGDLVDGTLDNPISTDEFGGTIFAGNFVWSSTAANGRAIGGMDAGDTCANWTTDAIFTEANFLGDYNATSFGWSAPGLSIATQCTETHRLYCIQQ